MRGRPQDNNRDNIPGPGTYENDVSAIKDRQHSANFGNSPQRDTMRSMSPGRDQSNLGPGAYNNRDHDITGNNSICYTIPKGEKKEGDDGYPGPGHYKIPCKFADTNAYSKINQSDEFKYV
jgi:hypothetical protein